MKYLMKLAIANIRRATRRTVLTFLVLGFGISLYIFLESFITGFENSSFDNLINFQTGHVKIHDKNFSDEKPYVLSNLIDNYETALDKISAKPYVTGATARVQFLGELDNMRDALAVVVVGIDFERDPKVYNLTNYLVDGTYNKDGILIGKTLAGDLGLKVGDYCYISLRKQQGAYVSIEKQITGLLNTSDPAVNNGSVFLDLGETLSLYGVNGVTEIGVKTGDVNKSAEYAAELKEAFPDLKVENWKEAAQQTIQMMEMERKFDGVIILFIIIIALVGIINTMLMSVYEKQREIGTLKAMGMTDAEVMRLFVIEGAIIGFLGGICGVVLGVIINWFPAEVGIDFLAMWGKGDLGAGIPAGVIKSEWMISPYLWGMALGIVSSMAASYYPAKKTSRMQPMECLRVRQ
ncbi:MAG: ABC transporter permease [Brevinematales bacterium]|nr:ABC transporter permease [Brevinematales bacterium]